MQFQERLLLEYRQLAERIALLNQYIDNHPGESLLCEQLECMMRYEAILFQRIVKLMEEKEPRN